MWFTITIIRFLNFLFFRNRINTEKKTFYNLFAYWFSGSLFLLYAILFVRFVKKRKRTRVEKHVQLSWITRKLRLCNSDLSCLFYIVLHRRINSILNSLICAGQSGSQAVGVFWTNNQQERELLIKVFFGCLDPS